MNGGTFKPGERRVGRKKGVPNKATAERQAAIAASGVTPLGYMLSVLQDEDEEPARRAWAAKEAAPYVHPKLAQIEHGNKNGEPFMVHLTNADGGLL